MAPFRKEEGEPASRLPRWLASAPLIRSQPNPFFRSHPPPGYRAATGIVAILRAFAYDEVAGWHRLRHLAKSDSNF